MILCCSSPCATKLDEKAFAKHRRRKVWNVFELRSKSDHWNQVDKFVLSCLIICVNWPHFWRAFKHSGWKPVKSSMLHRRRIRRNAARIRWIIRELRPDFIPCAFAAPDSRDCREVLNPSRCKNRYSPRASFQKFIEFKASRWKGFSVLPHVTGTCRGDTRDQGYYLLYVICTLRKIYDATFSLLWQIGDTKITFNRIV